MQCKFISSNSRDMPQAVNPRPVSAEARLLSRDNSCEIYSGQNGTGTGFSARSASPYQYQCFSLSVSVLLPISIIPPVLYIYSDL